MIRLPGKAPNTWKYLFNSNRYYVHDRNDYGYTLKCAGKRHGCEVGIHLESMDNLEQQNIREYGGIPDGTHNHGDYEHPHAHLEFEFKTEVCHQARTTFRDSEEIYNAEKVKQK